MSLWGSPSANAPSTYVSKLDLTLSRQGTVRSPPPAFESATRDSAFGMVASSANPEGRLPLPAKQSLGAKNPGRSASPSAGAFSSAHLSRLDTTLVHANRGTSALKDDHCMHPSTASSFHVPWRYSSSCWDLQGDEACVERQSCEPNLRSSGHGKEWPTNHPSTSRSSVEGGDPAKRNIFLPSAASSKEPPCWTSRLDVVLDTSRASTPRPVNRFHTAFASGRPAPSQQVCSRCMAQISDRQSSVKWHMSSCSMAVKPFQADTQGNSHAHSVLLVPKRWKMSNSSRGFPVSSQSPQQDFQPPGTPSLQITRFQVTSSAENAPPAHQTSTKEIWLSPTVLTREGSSLARADVVSADPDPNVFIFHDHHPGGTEVRNSQCAGLIPSHQKVSQISLILASPLAAMPFQVVRDYKRSPHPTILIQTHNPTTNGPSVYVGDGPTVSLTINPVCCPEVPMVQQHLGSRLSRGAPTADDRDTRVPFRNAQAPPANPSLGVGRGGPSVVVSIAALESGRRVVKISVSASRNPLEWGNTIRDGYRNITLGN